MIHPENDGMIHIDITPKDAKVRVKGETLAILHAYQQMTRVTLQVIKDNMNELSAADPSDILYEVIEDALDDEEEWQEMEEYSAEKTAKERAEFLDKHLTKSKTDES